MPLKAINDASAATITAAASLASDFAKALGAEVLIGQTILERMGLLVDYNKRRVIGTPDHPDQPVLKIR